MAITIGGISFPTLTAQPFGYEETDTREGQTARKWLITGLLKPTEWLSLLAAYDTWRNARINDEPTKISKVVGTTIAFSGNGPGGQSWTSVACWFIAAPQAEQFGAYLSASVELVDANQALAVLLKAEQDTEALPNLGTYTIGGATLTLLKPVDGYATSPTMELTAGGVHYVQGPLASYKIKDIEGTTDAAGWSSVRTWYEAQVTSRPAAGSYYPITAPTATAANEIVDGVTTVKYTVSIQLGLVR